MLHPEVEMYINDISRRLELDSGNLTRKLKELEGVGILSSEQRGKERYYFLNEEFPLLSEYRKIVLTTIGFEKLLAETLSSVKGVAEAFIYGSYAQDKMNAGSDIDVIVIGDQSTIELQKKIAVLQKSTDREINVISMGVEEFEKKKKKKDSFIKSVLGRKSIKVI
jgi:predicted nucleotidyltransferase